jgi:hypothetical protein
MDAASPKPAHCPPARRGTRDTGAAMPLSALGRSGSMSLSGKIGGLLLIRLGLLFQELEDDHVERKRHQPAAGCGFMLNDADFRHDTTPSGAILARKWIRDCFSFLLIFF